MVLLRSDLVNVRLWFADRFNYIAILGISFSRQITKSVHYAAVFQVILDARGNL